MHHLSITALARGLRAKEFSSVELAQAFLKRIKALDKQLNSFISLNDEASILAAAQAADQALQGPNPAPLTGIPIAHKDIFCTQGLKTTCASRMLENFHAPYDATIVTRLKAQHTVLLGKTNMDEFAMGSSNETSYFGPTKNPWDPAMVPGGSSGGSAAAVAARLVPAATGSDTGGSIRQPAALCGITGLKPTYGRVSRYGMIAYASSLDQAGPMAQTAEDCAWLLQAMAGFDPRDATSLRQAVPDYMTQLKQPIKGLRLGIPKEFMSASLMPEVAKACEEAIALFERQGMQIQEVSLPHTALSVPVYYIIAPAECASNLSRFDGVRYGYACSEPRDLEDLYKRSRSEGFGPEVQRRLLMGTYALSAGHYEAYYRKAQQVRRLIAQDYQRAFEAVDVLLCPTAPAPAFSLGSKISDPVSMYLSDIYTISINLAGLPALSLPGGFAQGLPLGIQLIGNHLSEGLLCQLGHQFQSLSDWHTKMPNLNEEVLS